MTRVENNRSEMGLAPNNPCLSSESYTFLRTFIYRETGIVLEEDRRDFLESRLSPVMVSAVARELQLTSFDMLVQKLAANASSVLTQLVIDGVTTNETLFFRDRPVFDALRSNIFPQLFKQIAGKRKLCIWSAASSTGQEAYSIALLLAEMGKSHHDVEILGTDISRNALERARKGSYMPFEVGRGLPPEYLNKYFTRMGTEWQLRNEIISMVRFEQADLRRDLRRLGTFDLILCRNVLIYFDMETKRRIIGSMEPMLNPGGSLVLGCAETLLNLSKRLQRKQTNTAAFYGLHDAA